jgi:hypothetical protein
MAKPATASEQRRSRLVGRLVWLFAFSVLAQAVVFIAIVAVYRIIAGKMLAAFAGDAGSLRIWAIVAVVVQFALEAFLALAIGFFAARRLAGAIARQASGAKRPPIQAVPYAAACAAALIVTYSLLEFAVKPQTGAGAWIILIVEDAAIAYLLFFAARRALRPRRA